MEEKPAEVHNKKSKKKIREKLLAEAEARLQRMIELEKSEKWVFKKHNKGVDIYQMKPPEGMHIDYIKGVGYITATMEEFHTFLNSGVELLKQVDGMFDYGENLAKLADGKLLVQHACFKAPGRPIISDRDFTYITYDRSEQFCGLSFDTEYYAEELDKLGVKRPGHIHGVVRGEVLGTAYFYRPVAGKPGQLQLIYICQVDAKGWIPTWVANLTASQQAMNVRSIAKYFDRMHGRQTQDAEDAEETRAAGADGGSKADASAPGTAGTEAKKNKKKKKKSSKKKHEAPAAAAAAAATAPNPDDSESGESDPEAAT